MKSLLLPALAFLPFFSIGQITFEKINSPADFNLSAIRKSPVGEYFVQTVNDDESIYTSMDGQSWTKASLPAPLTLQEIQFFSDGTPLLKADSDAHLIRRSGTWHTMEVEGGWNQVQASFIKEDTLFVFNNNNFAYSLDKGDSFEMLFNTGIHITDQTVHLYKLDHHFVLHHTAGASEFLSIFNHQGERVLYLSLDLVSDPHLTFNTCGEILINDYARYYIVRDQEPWLQSGLTNEIYGQFSTYSEIMAQHDTYYLRELNTVYTSSGCNFTWEALITDDRIGSREYLWIDHEEHIYLYDYKDDRYIEYVPATQQWQEHQLPIDYAYVNSVDESQENQISITSNALFRKQNAEPNWVELDSMVLPAYQVQYSPDGDLYINREFDILYSSDNGQTFSMIQTPVGQLPELGSTLHVLDNDILFIQGGVLDEAYYSVNNGKDWIFMDELIFYVSPVVQLVDNTILITDFDFNFKVYKVNLGSGEISNHILGEFHNFFIDAAAIQDDGTIYFYGSDIFGQQPEGLYRYRFGENAEFLGPFPEIGSVQSLLASGQNIYLIGSAKYVLINNGFFSLHAHAGLPSNGRKQFFISAKQHLYAIIDYHSIYRSARPLSFPKSITGTIYHQTDPGCATDTLDPTLRYWQVKVESDTYMGIQNTNQDGRFNFSVPNGEYTLSSQPINAYWDLCDQHVTVSVTDSTLVVSHDFVAKALAECASLEFDFSTPLLRRCFENYYSVRVHNTGPIASAGTTLTLKLDPFFDFLNASIPYTQLESHLIEFDLGVLEVNDEVTFRVNFSLSCEAELGMEHCLTGTLEDDHACTLDRSTYTECQMNIGSFDPNDKRVFNEAGEETGRVDKWEYIYYHIRFQNTGTDTAFTVRITDPLSPMLDLSTLQMLSASHPYTHEITDGPALLVRFDDILLPDSSTNESASHGYFKFRIKPLPVFDYGTRIPNQAAIYFDFNDPVLTNEAITDILPTVRTIHPEKYIDFEVYPNPAKEMLSVRIAESDLHRIGSYEIINHLGQCIAHSAYLEPVGIPVGHFTPGVYNLILKENNAIIGMKNFVRL